VAAASIFGFLSAVGGFSAAGAFSAAGVSSAVGALSAAGAFSAAGVFSDPGVVTDRLSCSLPWQSSNLPLNSNFFDPTLSIVFSLTPQCVPIQFATAIVLHSHNIHQIHTVFPFDNSALFSVTLLDSISRRLSESDPHKRIDSSRGTQIHPPAQTQIDFPPSSADSRDHGAESLSVVEESI
jgi:hypothetical protein